MLTLSTPPEQMIKEVTAEFPKALYWLRKCYGGNDKYGKMQDALLDKVQKSHQDASSEVFDYCPPSGNKWKVYEHCHYYPEAKAAYSQPFAFCYYETAGSIGAFIPGFNPQKQDERAVIIYTSHFFQRFCERLDVKPNSTTMVKQFLDFIPHQAIQTYLKREGENFHRIDVKFPGSIGRGIKYPGYPVFEIRTFLLDKSLSTKQKKFTKPVRDFLANYNFLPDELRLEMMKREDNGLYNELLKEQQRAAALGMDPKLIERYQTISVIIVSCYLTLNLVSAENRWFWKTHSTKCSPKIMLFCTQNKQSLPLLLNLIMECAEMDGLSPSKEAVALFILTSVYRCPEEEAKKILQEHPV